MKRWQTDVVCITQRSLICQVDKSTACRCISSMRSIVYHQQAVLYLIKSQEYAPSVMIYAYGDDIHAKA